MTAPWPRLRQQRVGLSIVAQSPRGTIAPKIQEGYPMHPAENAIAAIASVSLWEVCRWVWWDAEARRASRSHGPAFWAVLRRRFDEADEMRHCPTAEVDWDD